MWSFLSFNNFYFLRTGYFYYVAIFLFSAIFQIYISPLTLLASPHIYIFSLLLLIPLNVFLVFISFALLYYLVQVFKRVLSQNLEVLGLFSAWAQFLKVFCVLDCIVADSNPRACLGTFACSLGELRVVIMWEVARGHRRNEVFSEGHTTYWFTTTTAPLPPPSQPEDQASRIQPMGTDKSIPWKCFKDATPSACSWDFLMLFPKPIQLLVFSGSSQLSKPPRY